MQSGGDNSRFAAQLGLDIVDQMWIQFRMGSFGFTEFFGTDIFWEITYFQKHSSSRPPVLNSPN